MNHRYRGQPTRASRGLSSKRWQGRTWMGGVEPRRDPPGKGLGSRLEVKRRHPGSSLLCGSRDRLLEPPRQSLPALALGTSVPKIASSRTISHVCTACRPCSSFSDPCDSSLMKDSFENRYAK